MIVKGGAGGKGGHTGALSKHLMRTDENTRVEILEIDPAAPSDDLHAVLSEFQMLAQVSSKGELGFYQASINPQDDDRPLSPEEWKQAADILETKLGFEGQPRVIVLHEKEGREHIHVVWQRYDTEKGVLRDYKQNYKSHMEAAREIEETLDLHRFQDFVQDRSHDFPETQQSSRTDLSVADRKELITGLYRQSDSSNAFVSAMAEAGFDLARGDKPNTFVIIDHHGEVHSLVRQIDGAKKAEVHDKLLPRKPEHFKSVSEIKADRHHDQPAKQPDTEREHIRAQFAEERIALEARHLQERDNQKRAFEAQNKEISEKRGVELIAQDMKRRSNFGRPIVKQPLRTQNARWWREDQNRLTQQKIEFDRLTKRQAVELKQLAKDEARALGDHDRQKRSAERPRHAMGLQDRLLRDTRSALDAIDRDDRAPNSPVAWHSRQLARLEKELQAEERRLVTYLNNQEQAKRLFRGSYDDADAAYGAFRDHARTHGLKSAQNELERRPERFGEANSPPALADIEKIAPALRSVHYTEKKMFETRLRIDQDTPVRQLMAEHGIEGQAWEHNATAREDDLHQHIAAHKDAIQQAHEKPDDRRLLLMHDVTSAASSLDAASLGKLPAHSRETIKAIKTVLADPALQNRLAQLRMREAERDKAHDELVRSRGDPRYHQ